MFATIALGATQSPWGVASGVIAGHLVATSPAILGGPFLANYISEKLRVHLSVTLSPKHHPPGTGLLCSWYRSSRSIWSRIGSFALNGVVNSAPFITRSLKSLELSGRASYLELNEAYHMFQLIVV
ncbi:GDT1-like protein 2, chloroplastic [Capsicum baccatum]|uniref:GDT1 family protein n=1 Tax=Capsicum baccatum TaxID=33114 RepID=A0A2G2XI38_CAPBA|nr:GDT1-like protein 2, chloroplastic [Capsicum baccatum]